MVSPFFFCENGAENFSSTFQSPKSLFKIYLCYFMRMIICYQYFFLVGLAIISLAEGIRGFISYRNFFFFRAATFFSLFSFFSISANSKI